MPSTPAHVSAIALLAIAGTAFAQPASVDEARAQVEAAQAALEAAQAQLAAAEAEVAEAEAQAAEAEAAAIESGEMPAPEPPAFSEGWEGAVNAGISGTQGNSETFNFRISLDLARKTERMETTIGSIYRRESADGETTADRFQIGINNDWLVPDSRWRYFARGLYEYDTFQDWDHRISGFGGVGYEFIDNEKTTLVGRAGIGGSKTFGGEDDDFRPEALLGLDFTHQIADDQNFKAGTEVLPALDPVGDYRVNSYAEYQLVLDESSNMVLTTGVRHKYDSDPGGDADRSDLDYYLTLGWKF